MNTKAEIDAWNCGYLIAVSTMLHQHDCSVTAEDALNDSGITWDAVKLLGLDDFDLKVLAPIYANIARKEKYAQHRKVA